MMTKRVLLLFFFISIEKFGFHFVPNHAQMHVDIFSHLLKAGSKKIAKLLAKEGNILECVVFAMWSTFLTYLTNIRIPVGSRAR